MEKETVKENIEKISGIETMLKEVKALFSTEKKENPKAETPAEPTKETKVEFNHEEFTKNFNDYKSSIEEKFKSAEEKLTAFEAQIKTATDTISKQDEQLKKMFALVEKALVTPVAASKQTKKEGVSKIESPVCGLDVWK